MAVPLRHVAAPTKSDADPSPNYISRHELRVLFPVSDMTIWRWQHDPGVGFPAPIKLSSNGRNYWWLPEVRDWERRRREHVEPSRSAV